MADHRGENNPYAKLTESDVREIRRLYGTEPGLSYAKIASRFGVTRSYINHIVPRKTWGHI